MRIARLAVCLLTWLLAAAVCAESWPPLRPPDPLTVEWVVKQTLTRYPEVHARHRAYLAALARVPARGASETQRLAVEVAESAADLVFIDAYEHHLMLKWQAEQVFYDYLFAQEARVLIENQKDLWRAYAPALEAHTLKAPGERRDLALDTARLNAQLLKLEQDRLTTILKLNTLLDRHWEAPLSPVRLGEPAELPANREALAKSALQHAVTIRRVQAQLQRAGAIARLAEHNAADGEPREAALHEVARYEQQRRAAGTGAVRDVSLHYEAARLKRDVLKYAQGEMLPRTNQRLNAALAAYKTGSGDVMSYLDAHQAHVAVQLEALQWRIEYERTLSDLALAIGELPDYAVRTMNERPLNTVRDPNAKK